MAKGPDTSGYERFSDVTQRLDEIIGAVRDKNTSLERSLDLFDEAIALGTRAVDLVDKAAFSPEERERLAEPAGEGDDSSPSAEDGDAVSTNGSDAAEQGDSSTVASEGK